MRYKKRLVGFIVKCVKKSQVKFASCTKFIQQECMAGELKIRFQLEEPKAFRLEIDLEAQTFNKPRNYRSKFL